MKINIKIQSLSNIITNSSSEVFCIIESDKYLETIYDIISEALDNNDIDYGPVCNLDYKSDYDSDYYKDYSDKWISISVPYGWTGSNFYKLAIPLVLNEIIGENNYKITYDVDY